MEENLKISGLVKRSVQWWVTRGLSFHGRLASALCKTRRSGQLQIYKVKIWLLKYFFALRVYLSQWVQCPPNQQTRTGFISANTARPTAEVDGLAALGGGWPSSRAIYIYTFLHAILPVCIHQGLQHIYVILVCCTICTRERPLPGNFTTTPQGMSPS